MSWPGTDFECEIQDRLDRQAALIRELAEMLERFGRRDVFASAYAEVEALLDRDDVRAARGLP